MKQTSHDLIVSDEEEFVCDYFCPSVKPKISKCVCRVFGLYHASNKSAYRHRKNINGKVVQVSRSHECIQCVYRLGVPTS
ncbi:hypothetical protein PR048_023468 [Dryococelus australis]|uniref:Uncharacterized protein n=1 Tax=Dryococelus australis TaxID=614101 RepID=A0ABQ9GU74_9NEOP|nr:hypothetical protein PR048_023468 [Dryococelus australis]